MTALLEVRDLRIAFPEGGDRPIHPVDGVSFRLEAGETLAMVGESGSGKTLTALAILGLLPPPARLAPSTVLRFQGRDLPGLSERAWREIRGAGIGLVFQDPATSLNPLRSARSHVMEAVRAHRTLSRSDAESKTMDLFKEVGFPAGRERAYPHQLSGGLRQRVMIAVALAGEPDLLIADEPTSALDVTVQAQILELLDRLREQRRMSLLLITHDLSLVRGRSDRVAVMYAGQIVETGPTTAVFAEPAHPYTRGLLAAIPRLDGSTNAAPAIRGAPPRGAWPSGCRFHPRCPVALDRCRTDVPEGFEVGASRLASCWLVERGQG